MMVILCVWFDSYTVIWQAAVSPPLRWLWLLTSLRQSYTSTLDWDKAKTNRVASHVCLFSGQTATAHNTQYTYKSHMSEWWLNGGPIATVCVCVCLVCRVNSDSFFLPNSCPMSNEPYMRRMVFICFLPLLCGTQIIIGYQHHYTNRHETEQRRRQKKRDNFDGSLWPAMVQLCLCCSNIRLLSPWLVLNYIKFT